MDFTVAICTYNGRDRLPQVLESLKSQVNCESLNWEIIVVDNNSTDNTAEVVAAYQTHWQKSVLLKYCFASQQGAAFARRQAIKEAQAPLVGFLDDDNLPASDWVIAAYQFGQEHPLAGAYGSRIQGKFEKEPPPNFERIQAFFALTDRGSTPKLYSPQQKILPPSAGLVIRKKAWLESVPKRCILSGRTPGNMLTGEDLEAVAYLQKAGWELWYNPKMQVQHQISPYRLEKEYLLPFFHGIGLSRFVTRTVNIRRRHKPIVFLAYLLNDARKVAWHFFKYGNRLETDLVAACEMELYLGSLKSPYFLWKNKYLSLISAQKINQIR